MERFHRVEDAAVIIHARGVTRQVDLYRRGNMAYAKHGSGFIRLVKGNGTSVPAITWVDIDPGDMVIGESDLRLTLTPRLTVAAE